MMVLLDRISPKQGLILLGLASAGLLGAAFVFQYGFGLWPCTMCLWQRWPHWLMVGLAGLGLVGGRRALLLLMVMAAAVMLTSAGLAGWHSGVEQGVLPGPAACSGGLSLAGDASAVLDAMLAAPAPSCDKVPWSFLGLSMANWNGIVSFAMAGLAIIMLVRLVKARYADGHSDGQPV